MNILNEDIIYVLLVGIVIYTSTLILHGVAQ